MAGVETNGGGKAVTWNEEELEGQVEALSQEGFEVTEALESGG